LTQYFSSLTEASSENLLSHLRTHAQTHVVNIGHFLGLLNSTEQNAKAAMEGVVQRYNQQGGTVSLVDIFGMLLGAILLTKKEEKISNRSKEREESEVANNSNRNTEITVGVDVMLPGIDQKISKQQQYVKDGRNPMPIYCAVRHAVRENHTITDDTGSTKASNANAGEKKQNEVTNTKNDEPIHVEQDKGQSVPMEENTSEEQDVYQWFEFTPFEVGSEELSGRRRIFILLAFKAIITNRALTI
jgi:phospholipase A2